MNAWLVMVAALGLAVIISALAVVYSQHESRRQFVELQQLQSERDELNVEWGRLQLEQSAWATHGRVEGLASEDLDMRLPDPDTVVIVRP